MAVVLFDKKIKCCGCASCSNVCSQQCIIMEADEEGFKYPSIDNSKCVECRKCINVCPINQTTNDGSFKESQYYSAQHKDDEVIMESSSGGVFSALANIVLKQGGVVYGCAYNENMHAVHIGIEESAELKRLRGSKYVQSDMQGCYSQIKRQLDEKRSILFTGTACQVAGLKTFLGKEYENILLVDVLCHGVPSPMLFENYNKYLDKKHRGKVVNYEFRNKKKNGWGSEHRSYYEVEKNGKITGHRPILPAYFCAFFWGLNLRPSCYECQYAVPKRNSDITMGDFWGFYNTYKKYFPKGISVMSINTFKGEKVKNLLTANMELLPITFEQATKTNTNFTRSVTKPKVRDEFYRKLRDKPYKAINRMVFLNCGYRKLFTSIYGRFVPSGVRRIIKFGVGGKRTPNTAL